MIVATGQLKDRPRRFEGEESETLLDLGGDPMVVPTGPWHYDLLAERIGGELLVRGRLTLPVRMLCSRCGDTFGREVTVPDVTHAYPLESDHESIDLTDDLREDILLALPANWVCAESCKGVCVRCGANRNRQSCACEPGAGDAEWHALDRLPL